METTAAMERTAKQEQDERKYHAMMTQIVTRLSEITDWPEARRILACMDIMRDANTSCSPAETFIDNLIDDYAADRLDPEYAAKELEDFKEAFPGAIIAAKRFQQHRPKATLDEKE